MGTRHGIKCTTVPLIKHNIRVYTDNKMVEGFFCFEKGICTEKNFNCKQLDILYIAGLSNITYTSTGYTYKMFVAILNDLPRKKIYVSTYKHTSMIK